jgi:hypothetical protein
MPEKLTDTERRLLRSLLQAGCLELRSLNESDTLSLLGLLERNLVLHTDGFSHLTDEGRAIADQVTNPLHPRPSDG